MNAALTVKWEVLPSRTASGNGSGTPWAPMGILRHSGQRGLGDQPKEMSHGQAQNP